MCPIQTRTYINNGKLTLNNSNVPMSCKKLLCLNHFCIFNLKGMWHHNVLFLSLSSSCVDTALMSIGVHVADLRST